MMPVIYKEVRDLPRNPKHRTSASRRWSAATPGPSTCTGPACCFGSSIGEPEWQCADIAHIADAEIADIADADTAEIADISDVICWLT